MKKKFFITILLLCAFFRSSDAQAANPAGTYSISRGINADNGSEYTGEVTVEYRGDNVYYVYWKIPGALYRGVGHLDHNTLAVGWSSAPGYGLVVYKVEGGKLYGDWLADDSEFDFGQENLEGPPGLNGVYEIVEAYGADMGDKYYGTVEIRPNGEVYNLTWQIDNNVYTGVGLLKGDSLIVGWGSAAGVVYYDIKDNELLGRWASPGASVAGVENLVRVSPLHNSVASTMKIEELTPKIEKALDQINSMTHDYVLRYRAKGADATQTTDLIKASFWYKKPDLAREESVTLYLPTGPRKNAYIIKLEGANFNTYELLSDGSAQKNSYPAEEWQTSGYTPDDFYADIKKRIKESTHYSLEYQKDRNVYILKFDSPDQAVFEISGESWLPYAVSVFDRKENAIVETVWNNIKINPEIPDEIFRVPNSGDTILNSNN